MLISAAIAFFRGFIKEVLTILGLGGAGLASYLLGGQLVPFALDFLGPVETDDGPRKIFGFVPVDLMADIIGYGGVFVLVFIVLAVITHMISESAEGVGLGPLDRSLGIVFGLARGLLLVALLYLPFSLIVDEDEFPEWITEARSMVVVEMTANWVRGFVSDDTIKEARKKTKATRKKVEKAGALSTYIGGNEKTAAPGETGYGEDAREGLNELFEREQNQ